MKFKRILSAVALVAVATASQSALAATITTTYAGSADFTNDNVNNGVGYYFGKIVPNPNSTTALKTVGIGGDSFTSTNHTYDFSVTGQFNTWCVDIYHWLTGGAVIYTVATGADLATALDAIPNLAGTGATRVAKLGQLANDVYSTVDTKVESAAFQLAVWAITYGTADGTGHYHVDTTNTGFRVDSGTATSAYGNMAEGWLANLGTALEDTGNYKLTYLNDAPVNSTQDMVVFTPVPEPAALGLLAIGLLGLGFGIRKRA